MMQTFIHNPLHLPLAPAAALGRHAVLARGNDIERVAFPHS